MNQWINPRIINNKITNPSFYLLFREASKSLIQRDGQINNIGVKDKGFSHQFPYIHQQLQYFFNFGCNCLPNPLQETLGIFLCGNYLGIVFKLFIWFPNGQWLHQQWFRNQCRFQICYPPFQLGFLLYLIQIGFSLSLN